MSKGLMVKQGFTLIEILIVIAIIAILAAIAYPSYQNYVIKTKRTDTMTELQNIASQIESQKVAMGSYTQVKIANWNGNYPRTGTALYTFDISPTETDSSDNSLKLSSGEWTITATPVTTGQMKNDGVLTLNHLGLKCRANTCGYNKEWNE